MRRTGKIALWSLGAALALLAAGFALIQTGNGKGWLVATANRALSSPTSTVQLGAIDGLVPFRMRIDRIVVSDAAGPWLTVDRALVSWSPSALLRGRLRIDRLEAQSVTVLRQPATATTSQSSGPVLPRLPVAVELDHLAVPHFVVGPALTGGDNAEASIDAHGLLTRQRADLSVRLARTDGQPGSGSLDAAYDQPANQLALRLDIDEPTGILLDGAMARTDHLPLRVTLDGAGPLSAWQGDFHLVSGQGIHGDATLAIANRVGTRIALKGLVVFGPLAAEDVRPILGDAVTFDIAAAEDGKGGIRLEPSQIALAAVTIKAEGTRSDSGQLDGKLHIAVPDIAAAQPLVGKPTTGTLDIDAALSGTVDRPKLAMAEHGGLAVGDVAVDGLTITAGLTGVSGGQSDDPDFDLIIDAKADNLRGIADQKAFGPLSLHLAGATDVKGRRINIAQLQGSAGGVELSGAGSIKDGVADGKASLTARDLSLLGGLFGQTLAGAAAIDIMAKTDPQRTVTVTLGGKAEALRTGSALGDALTVGGVSLSASATRTASGGIRIANFTAASARVKLAGRGAFDPAGRAIDGAVDIALADLAALSQPLGTALAGSGRLSAKLGGTLDAPDIDADAAFDHLALGKARLDQFAAELRARDGLRGGAALSARFSAGKLTETIDADLGLSGSAYRIQRLHMTGSGATADAALTVDPTARRVAGKLTALVPDLTLWSGLFGRSLAGQLAVSVDLPADSARQGPVKATIDHISVATDGGAVTIGHAALVGTLSGDFARQNGVLDLSLAGLAAQDGTLTRGDAHLSLKGRQSDFRVQATGRAGEPIDIALAGSATQGAESNTLRIAGFAAKTGADSIALTKPALLVIGPQSYRLTGLAISVDGGAVDGDLGLSTTLLDADLRLRKLPLRPLAALAGRAYVGGTLDGRLTLSGTPRKPVGRLSLTTADLDVQTDGPLPRPALSLNADAEWRDDRLSVNAKAATGSGETLTLTGTAPLTLDNAALTPRIPPGGILALAIKGGGRLENLSAIVPLGEDRIAGGFAVDLAVGGTAAAPRPSGRIAVTGGRYTNMALGTGLEAIDLSLSSAGERFTLDRLTATDGKSGRMSASGAIDFEQAPATVAFTLGFTDFLVARGDNMTIRADGDLKLGGTAKAMGVSGKLSVRNAELYIPDRLPASVVRLDVTEIGGAAKTAPATKSEPVAPVALQIALDAPGQIFVRGHGVTSEWRGHVDIGGSTSAPSLAGQLTVNRGGIDLLGQTFTIDRGTIGFVGGTTIDPVLNVQASAAAGSLTALVTVTGTALAPKIALSSTPALPQDEVLARVLFGANVGTLTPSQGLQLAAAAATLAQGGPGLLDRVRGTIGLDRLDLSAGGANAAGTQGVAKGTTVSGGKYIANGVFVGVAQGLGTNASQAKVEVEITPNISINSTFGTASGSGFGAKYSIDY